MSLKTFSETLQSMRLFNNAISVFHCRPEISQTIMESASILSFGKKIVLRFTCHTNEFANNLNHLKKFLFNTKQNILQSSFYDIISCANFNLLALFFQLLLKLLFSFCTLNILFSLTFQTSKSIPFAKDPNVVQSELTSSVSSLFGKQITIV